MNLPVFEFKVNPRSLSRLTNSSKLPTFAATILSRADPAGDRRRTVLLSPRREETMCGSNVVASQLNAKTNTLCIWSHLLLADLHPPAVWITTGNEPPCSTVLTTLSVRTNGLANTNHQLDSPPAFSGWRTSKRSLLMIQPNLYLNISLVNPCHAGSIGKEAEEEIA